MFIGTGLGIFIGLSDIEAVSPDFAGYFLLDSFIYGILGNDLLA